MPDRPDGQPGSGVIDSVLLSTVQICTFAGERPLTNASGFFFARGDRLFLVTSRHVMVDEESGHHPDRVEIGLHSNPNNMAESVGFSIPLYTDGMSNWREGFDGDGAIDAAVIEIDRAALPASTAYRAFTPEHIAGADDRVEIGTSLLVLGFPLGFHDTLHHMPVARQAIVASSFGLRFQGHGYFLTDARTHRGTSGAPVVMRVHDERRLPGDLPWLLFGVHSARFDVGTRDQKVDEALGLNCVWYADILLTLTQHRG